MYTKPNNNIKRTLRKLKQQYEKSHIMNATNSEVCVSCLHQMGVDVFKTSKSPMFESSLVGQIKVDCKICRLV